MSHSKLDETNTSLPQILDKSENTLRDIKITPEDVLDQLKSIDITKSSGPDLISPLMLKEGKYEIVQSLTKLFNLSIESSVFPQVWKNANVSPLHKKNAKNLVSNYRPISLLSCVGKLFERIIFKYTFNFIRDNDLITTKQSGFKPGDSTVYQLTHIYHLFAEALDKKKDVRIVFCDISKAFDRVWHAGLIHKLKKIRIDGKLLLWFQNYLNKRRQRVVVNGQCSSWGEVLAGVPQGSVLGPLLFLIYINDITDTLDSQVRLFADDTMVYVYVDNPQTSADQLNADLSKITSWAKTWLVSFSPEKTKSMLCTQKRSPPIPDLFFDGKVLENVIHHKHLGITLQSNLKWDNHITEIITKVNKRLDIMTCLKYKLDRKTLEKMYFAFIRPIIEYGNNIWSNCNAKQTEDIEKLQKRAARVITGGIIRTPTDVLYQELGWESLESRRDHNNLILLHKTIRNETPQYLYDTISPNMNKSSDRPRRQNFLQPFNCRTQTFYNSFYCKTVREFNNLDSSLRENNLSTASLKSKLNLQKRVPPWYSYGNRKLSIIQSRLRMKCSPLNDDLFNLNIIEHFSCLCTADKEDAHHYFLECPLYNDLRTDLFRNLNSIGIDISLQIILTGDETKDRLTNNIVMSYVQEFINNTDRF